MDLATIQAIATIVNGIGLPATIGLVILLAAYNLLPVLAEYLRSKIAVNHATAVKLNGNSSSVPPYMIP